MKSAINSAKNPESHFPKHYGFGNEILSETAMAESNIKILQKFDLQIELNKQGKRTGYEALVGGK